MLKSPTQFEPVLMSNNYTSQDQYQNLLNTEAAPLDMLTSFARLKKQLKDNLNSQVENNQIHDNQEARCITPTNQQRNVAKDKYTSGDRGIVTTSTDQDGLIRYGTVQKQE